MRIAALILPLEELSPCGIAVAPPLVWLIFVAACLIVENTDDSPQTWPPFAFDLRIFNNCHLQHHHDASPSLTFGRTTDPNVEQPGDHIFTISGLAA